jgi:hypothetical protein
MTPAIRLHHFRFQAYKIVSLVFCFTVDTALKYTVSRGVLPSVVCLKSVWSWSLEKWGGLGPQGALEPLEKKKCTVAVKGFGSGAIALIFCLFTSIEY